MKNRIKLSENDLHIIIKESVNKILNESSYSGENYDEYEELIDILNEQFDGIIDTISQLQTWYLNNVEGHGDMYNSYAGKYGSEAKHLINMAYKKLGSMLNVEY